MKKGVESTMNVRTYRGKDRAMVMTRIREELGEEVTIVSFEERADRSVEIQVQSTGRDPRLSEDSWFELPASTLPKSELHSMLCQQGVCLKLQDRILEKVARLSRGQTLDRAATSGLAGLFQFDATIPAEQHYVALVGPTGVGKTTTLAKIAAQMKVAFEINIGIVSLDNYRVGAGYQLQTYASLLNIPYRQLAKQEGVRAGLERIRDEFSRCDLVLVDTPGFNPRDRGKVSYLCNELAPLKWIEKMLVLPAPSNDHDLRMAAKAFLPAGVERVVLSKIDESGYLGPVINTVAEIEKPMAFFTTGQRVPEDIEPASARRLGWMLTRAVH
jgi:flagellar biosynthesis GTPase FlhF